MPLRPLTAGLSLVLVLSTVASASDDLEFGCFDTKVIGRIVKQTPTALPDDGDGFITVSWPWVDRLVIEQVLMGSATRGLLRVLVFQHTDFARNAGSGSWWLRRNDQGGFNLLRSGGQNLKRCGSRSSPARAYVRLSAGQTLEDLELKSEAWWAKRNNVDH